jgi:protein TonB
VTSPGVNALTKTETVLTAYPVPPEPPPPPIVKRDPKPDIKSPLDEPVRIPPVDPKTPSDNKVTTTTEPGPRLPPGPAIGTGDIPTVITPPPLPVMVDAQYDQRYANALQPAYPAAEVRAGNTGRVVLRVLIGADGRVKQVERVSSASDAFFAAAEHQALTKWRFKPATRDGVAIEQWKTMSLRFELNDQ